MGYMATDFPSANNFSICLLFLSRSFLGNPIFMPRKDRVKIGNLNMSRYAKKLSC